MQGFPYEGHVDNITQTKDILPTILSVAGIDCGIKFDGRDMTKAVTGEGVREEPEFYITECYLDAQARLAHSRMEAHGSA